MIYQALESLRLTLKLGRAASWIESRPVHVEMAS
jgi:hypothetical protein